MVENFMIEKSGVEMFTIKKIGVETSTFEKFLLALMVNKFMDEESSWLNSLRLKSLGLKCPGSLGKNNFG